MYGHRCKSTPALPRSSPATIGSAPVPSRGMNNDLLAVLLGAGIALVASVLTGWLAEWRADRRSRRTFQRDTLLALQHGYKAYFDVLTAPGGLGLLKERDPAQWREFLRAQMDLMQLVDRITDSALRNDFVAVVDDLRPTALADAEPANRRAAVEAFMAHYGGLQDRIGVALREYL